MNTVASSDGAKRHFWNRGYKFPLERTTPQRWAITLNSATCAWVDWRVILKKCSTSRGRLVEDCLSAFSLFSVEGPAESEEAGVAAVATVVVAVVVAVVAAGGSGLPDSKFLENAWNRCSSFEDKLRGELLSQSKKTLPSCGTPSLVFSR